MEQNPRTSSSSSEDDYISMEVDDVTLFHHHHIHHRRHRSSSAKEFEFQSFSSSSDADRSPADELFYMGKLLPLHLPPRLQMVHTIFLNQNHHANDDDDGDELFVTPPVTTPFQSCNITPSESCHVSAELDPAEYFRDYLSEAKKSTAKGKRSSGIGSKLNWGYFKSLFTKSSGCSNRYSAAAATSKIRPIPKQCAAAYKGDSRSDAAPFGQIRYKRCSNSHLTTTEDDRIDYRRGGQGGGGHRRSFSGAFKRLSNPGNFSNPAPLVTASESSSNSKNYRQILKRCSSSNCSLEMENPIQAAIAHCKRSQQRPLMAMT